MSASYRTSTDPGRISQNRLDQAAVTASSQNLSKLTQKGDFFHAPYPMQVGGLAVLLMGTQTEGLKLIPDFSAHHEIWRKRERS